MFTVSLADLHTAGLIVVNCIQRDRDKNRDRVKAPYLQSCPDMTKRLGHA
jgi:hypothetical protein